MACNAALPYNGIFFLSAASCANRFAFIASTSAWERLRYGGISRAAATFSTRSWSLVAITGTGLGVGAGGLAAGGLANCATSLRRCLSSLPSLLHAVARRRFQRLMLASQVSSFVL